MLIIIVIMTLFIISMMKIITKIIMKIILKYIDNNDHEIDKDYDTENDDYMANDDDAEPQGAAADHSQQHSAMVQQIDGAFLTPDSISPEHVAIQTLDHESSMDWDNYASDPSFLTGEIPTTKRKRKSSTRDDFIDETNTSITTSDDDQCILDEPPRVPPRARSRTSVIQCNSYTCKPKHFKT